MKTEATILMTQLALPSGEKVPAWVVSAVEPEQTEEDRVVFTGPHGSERATEYARSRYAKVHYRVHALPGKIGVEVMPLRGQMQG